LRGRRGCATGGTILRRRVCVRRKLASCHPNLEKESLGADEAGGFTREPKKAEGHRRSLAYIRSSKNKAERRRTKRGRKKGRAKGCLRSVGKEVEGTQQQARGIAQGFAITYNAEGGDEDFQLEASMGPKRSGGRIMQLPRIEAVGRRGILEPKRVRQRG